MINLLLLINFCTFFLFLEQNGKLVQLSIEHHQWGPAGSKAVLVYGGPATDITLSQLTIHLSVIIFLSEFPSQWPMIAQFFCRAELVVSSQSWIAIVGLAFCISTALALAYCVRTTSKLKHPGLPTQALHCCLCTLQ